MATVSFRNFVWCTLPAGVTPRSGPSTRAANLRAGVLSRPNIVAFVPSGRKNTFLMTTAALLPPPPPAPRGTTAAGAVGRVPHRRSATSGGWNRRAASQKVLPPYAVQHLQSFTQYSVMTETLHALPRRSDEALGVRVNVTRIAPSPLLTLNAQVYRTLEATISQLISKGPNEPCTADKASSLYLLLTQSNGACMNICRSITMEVEKTGRVAPGSSHLGIAPDDATGWAGFLGDLPSPPTLSFRRCSILISIILIGSQDLAVKSRPNIFTHSLWRNICIVVTVNDLRVGIGKFREFNDLYARLHNPLNSRNSDICSLAVAPLGSPLVDDRPLMNAVKYRVVSGVVWTNRTMIREKIPPTCGIVRHDYHMRKYISYPVGNRSRRPQGKGVWYNHYTTAARFRTRHRPVGAYHTGHYPVLYSVHYWPVIYQWRAELIPTQSNVRPNQSSPFDAPSSRKITLLLGFEENAVLCSKLEISFENVHSGTFPNDTLPQLVCMSAASVGNVYDDRRSINSEDPSRLHTKVRLCFFAIGPRFKLTTLGGLCANDERCIKRELNRGLSLGQQPCSEVLAPALSKPLRSGILESVRSECKTENAQPTLMISAIEFNNESVINTYSDSPLPRACIPVQQVKMKRGEYGAAPECTGGGKREIPEKTRRPEASCGTIPTCENPRATPPGIEPGSPSRMTFDALGPFFSSILLRRKLRIYLLWYGNKTTFFFLRDVKSKEVFPLLTGNKSKKIRSDCAMKAEAKEQLDEDLWNVRRAPQA
ncbi:hypothetical protein PR048_027564 [Dryococelus australis]|uniref:Uncharacterized protein n=1 Tax=Dryococelus australis TaxID=614101 RepID=A0ABQ9GGV9_9NEOP|nr:hypothetical protein PR048_027564 [Dryococelus australis]